MTKDIAAEVGGWLPSDRLVEARWLDTFVRDVQVKRAAKALPPLKQSLVEFRDYVFGNPEVYVLFMDMFKELAQKDTPSGYPKVESFDEMLTLVGAAVCTVPEYNETGLVGFPVNVILNWAMGTRGGYAAFLHQGVNRRFEAVLNEWAQFLESPASKEPMKAANWFEGKALKAMSDLKPDGTVETPFEILFRCDPRDEYYGFESWNDFFTRDFADLNTYRPVATDGGGDPGKDTVIASACEAYPYRVRSNVKLYDHFSVKGQPYSLAHLLDAAHKGKGEPPVDYFEGGTVYQGFLAALSFHQWHCPIDGKVIAWRVVPGSYYSEAPSTLCDPAAPDVSQGYIAHVATRALVFIEAANKDIGIVCFVAIGMAEVSSCKLEEKIKNFPDVVKGQKLGEFQYGGSSHCLIFNSDVKLDFVQPVKDAEDIHKKRTNIRVNAELARVVKG